MSDETIECVGCDEIVMVKTSVSSITCLLW